MQRNQPRLAEFALADGKQITFGVDVAALQSQGLTEPQTGACHKADEGGVALWSESAVRAESRRGPYERRNFLFRIDMGLRAAMCCSKQAFWGNLGARLQGTQMTCQTSDNLKSPCLVQRRTVLSRPCPSSVQAD